MLLCTAPTCSCNRFVKKCSNESKIYTFYKTVKKIDFFKNVTWYNPLMSITSLVKNSRVVIREIVSGSQHLLWIKYMHVAFFVERKIL